MPPKLSFIFLNTGYLTQFSFVVTHRPMALETRGDECMGSCLNKHMQSQRGPVSLQGIQACHPHPGPRPMLFPQKALSKCFPANSIASFPHWCPVVDDFIGVCMFLWLTTKSRLKQDKSLKRNIGLVDPALPAIKEVPLWLWVPRAQRKL